MSFDADVGEVAPTAHPVALSPSAPPAVLGGRYEIGRRVGGGGAATVYAARDLVLGRAVAVKVMRSDDEPDHAGRFDQEARLLAGLSHPGLVTVHDAGSDVGDGGDPQAYLVMELVDGTTLGRRLASGPLSVDETADIGRQLAAALAYVHDQGIVHRDVKPANILITPPTADRPTTAKLTDFGIARHLGGERLTMHGFTVGTANYLSPEQATGAEVGTASDVYSLGLVLLECLTGVVAYPGSGVAAASARLYRQPTIPPWVSPEWVRLIQSMTDREPANRIDAGNAAAELARLRAVESTVDRTRVLPVLPMAVAHTRRRPRRGALVGSAVAAAVLAMAVISATAFGPKGLPSGVRPPSSTTRTTPAAPRTTRATQPQPVVVRSSSSTRVTHAAPAPATAQKPAPASHGKHGKHGGGEGG